jgi:hypothetical protein
MVYAPIAHWVWEPGGWLARMGALDFAGGSVVHVNAGIAGLVCAYVLGPAPRLRPRALRALQPGLTMVGAGLLWVGWFGFNAGSAVAADGRAGLAMAGHAHCGGGRRADLDGRRMDGAAPAFAAGPVLGPGGRAGGHHASGRLRLAALGPGHRRWPGWPATGAPRASSACWAPTIRWTCSACTASAASWARCSPACSPTSAISGVNRRRADAGDRGRQRGDLQRHGHGGGAVRGARAGRLRVSRRWSRWLALRGWRLGNLMGCRLRRHLGMWVGCADVLVCEDAGAFRARATDTGYSPPRMSPASLLLYFAAGSTRYQSHVGHAAGCQPINQCSDNAHVDGVPCAAK